jgi:hypothetical protein
LLLSTIASATGSTTTLNSTIVNSAISTVNTACGSTFISLSANTTTSTSGAKLQTSSSPGWLGVALMLGLALCVSG